MDIKELDKKQLILLTLLITFVVSIATGIVTVSLMSKMPKIVPQTINNVIQRTIEKVTTVQVPTPTTDTDKTSTGDSVTSNQDDSVVLSGDGDALVSIYLKNTNTSNTTNGTTTDTNGNVIVDEPAAIGQGIIVSDIGLILVDSSLIKDSESYKVILNKTDFDVSVLKKFDNGFTVLKISPVTPVTPAAPDTAAPTQ